MAELLKPFWHPSVCLGFILDWDGVLADTRLDFSGIRKKYFEGKRVPLIEAAQLLTQDQKEELWNDIYALEMEGAAKAVPVDGSLQLVQWLDDHEIPWAVVSRNCMDSINLAADRIGFPLPEVTMSRDDGPQKPDPEALWLAAKRIGIQPSRCVMVGDFLYDLVGARRAGMRSVLVERTGEDWDFWADACFPRVTDLLESLSDPAPLVPWEYHSLVNRKSKEWLLRAWNFHLHLPSEDPNISQKAFRGASLGIGHISVSPGGTVSMDQWENWPGATSIFLDAPLVKCIRTYIEGHFPLVSIEESYEGYDPGNRDLGELLEERIS
ncbi:MAG TPA: HAD-IA family hydrolase [Synergistales bacterium]|nr:HAD-IA family hydrolase [Synergistales bacterium]